MVESPQSSPVVAKPMKIDQYMTGINVRSLVQIRNFGRVQYRLGSVLGKGGFAKVYQAEQTYTSKSGIDVKRVVAVKIVPKKRITRQDQMDRVRSEMDIQSSINHTNIVKMLTNWEDHEKYCMVLEYCEEKTLLTYVRLFPSKQVPETEAVSVMKQLLIAVDYLHKQDIIHRDIKLGNVLRSKGVVKLADFGLAANVLTDNTKQLCGTPNFLPPEVYTHRHHSKASDMWAIGCVLFTLLVGENPFKYTNMAETKATILAHAYEVPEFLSYDADEVIRQLLSFNYQERPTAEKTFMFRWFTKHNTSELSKRTSSMSKARRSLFSDRNDSPSPAKRALHDLNRNIHVDNEGSPKPNTRTTQSAKLQFQRRLDLDSSRDSSQGGPSKKIKLPETSKPNNMGPGVFITKWLDYYDQIGLGCMFSDGSTSVLLKNGVTVRGSDPMRIEYLRESHRAIITDESSSEERAGLRRWKQFDKYMRANLIDGIETDYNDDAGGKKVSVHKFSRNDRAIAFQLTNGTRQINFLSGRERGLKFVVYSHGILKVEARKQQLITWETASQALDEEVLGHLLYAHEQFNWLKHNYGPLTNKTKDKFEEFIKSYQ